MMKSSKLEIATKFVLHERIYSKTVIIDSAVFPLRTIDWLWESLIHLAEQSKLQPRHEQDMIFLELGLREATCLRTWMLLATTSIGEISCEMVVAFFAEYEERLLERIGETHKAARMSTLVRHLVGSHLKERSNDVQMQRLHQRYAPRRRVVSRGRGFISDLPNSNRPPLIAIGHANLADLQHESHQTLLRDLDEIRNASLAVLHRYEMSVEALEKWENYHIDDQQEMRIRLLTLKVGRKPHKEIEWSHEEIDVYLALSLSILKKQKPPFERVANPSRMCAKNVEAHLIAKIENGPGAKSIDQLLALREAPSAEVLLACALLIQIKTGWNFISVLKLPVSQLNPNSFPHLIQSVKSRTRDETPPVFIERGDADVLLAMRVLYMRYMRLKQLGFDKPSPWLSSRSYLHKKTSPVVGWGSVLGSFRKKYRLPSFSLEMIRNQVLGVQAVANGDLETASKIAGHAQTATTARYVQSAIMQRLNAANSYEFESRFDATIRYLIDPTKISDGQRLIPYPIGDGASCKNPRSPPTDSWADKGQCRAENCHRNDGCANRILDITRERIEEVVRTKQYYDQNWNRLLNENPTAFEKIHLQKIEFNYGLYGALRRGPYRHLLKKDEKF